MTNPTITAYNWVPDFAQGQVRDLRVAFRVGNRLGGKVSPASVGQQHDIHFQRKTHHRRCLVGKLRIVGRANRCIKGFRSREILDRKVDENHLRHGISPDKSTRFDLHFMMLTHIRQP